MLLFFSNGLGIDFAIISARVVLSDVFLLGFLRLLLLLLLLRIDSVVAA